MTPCPVLVRSTNRSDANALDGVGKFTFTDAAGVPMIWISVPLFHVADVSAILNVPPADTSSVVVPNESGRSGPAVSVAVVVS